MLRECTICFVISLTPQLEKKRAALIEMHSGTRKEIWGGRGGPPPNFTTHAFILAFSFSHRKPSYYLSQAYPLAFKAIILAFESYHTNLRKLI